MRDNGVRGDIVVLMMVCVLICGGGDDGVRSGYVAESPNLRIHTIIQSWFSHSPNHPTLSVTQALAMAMVCLGICVEPSLLGGVVVVVLLVVVVVTSIVLAVVVVVPGWGGRYFGNAGRSVAGNGIQAILPWR